MLSQRPTEKVAVIDFDGTLCEFQFPDVGPPQPHVRRALETIRKAGYKIKIHSCRTATYWGGDSERTHDLPYDEIIVSPTMDKPIAEAYIDDRAITYENNWLEIAEALK